LPPFATLELQLPRAAKFQPGNKRAKRRARRYRFHDAGLKSVAKIRCDRAIDVGEAPNSKFLNRRGNNYSFAELFFFGSAHPANKL
jgi:hypothetical protein